MKDVVTALLAALKDGNQDVRKTPAAALTNASCQREDVIVLINTLGDENKAVVQNTLQAIIEIIKRSPFESLPDILLQLSNFLQHPSLDMYVHYGEDYMKGYDWIFNTINAYALYPSV